MVSLLRLPEERVSRRPPANLDASDNLLFAHEYARDLCAVETEQLSRVAVLSNGTIVRGLKLLAQSFACPPTGLRRLKVVARALQQSLVFPHAIHVSRGLFATDEYSNGFFHWICDVLPRIEALNAAVAPELVTRTLVVPSMADFPYVLPSLSLFKIGELKILRRRECAVCRDLLVLPAVAPTGNYRPTLMRSLRERFTASFGKTGGSRKIFVSRAAAPKRKIINEQEILPVLRRHDVESVVLERLSFPEQVRLLSSTSILVGNHGAGLTNMAWMAPGSRVLELRRSGDRENNCYFSLAAALDLHYHYLQCNVTDERQPTQSADFIVDPIRLDHALSSLNSL